MFRATKVVDSKKPIQAEEATTASQQFEECKQIVARVRSKDGTFRFDVSTGDTVFKLKQLFEEETKVPVDKLTLVLQLQPKKQLTDSTTLRSIGAQNGELFLASYPTSILSTQEVAENEKRKQREREENDPENYQLRKQKKQWTYAEFQDLVAQNKISINYQKYGITTKVSVDKNAIKCYQSFLQATGYQMKRMGFLYGTKNATQIPADDEESAAKDGAEKAPTECWEITADVIYEPPQENNDDSIQEIADQKGTDRAEALATLFGLHPVGWIVSYSGSRSHGLTAAEVLKAAELQAKYGPHFVTVLLGLNEEQQVSVEAFQVSKQCVDLFQKGLFEIDPKNTSALKTKKNVEVGKKSTREVECILLITNAGIVSHESMFQVGFPPRNRPDYISKEYKQTMSVLRDLLKRRERSGQKFMQRIMDFHLLLFVAEQEILSLKSDFPVLVDAIKTKNPATLSNYELIMQAYCSST